jgi:transposase-like protein
LEHTRIDEGIKRGPRKKPSDLERQTRDEAGRFLTSYTPELKQKAIQDALVSLECGARVEEVAERHQVPVSTMYSWLVGTNAGKLRTQFFDGMAMRNLTEIRTAMSPLELARAREELSGWVKVAERRDPSAWAQKQEVTHNLPQGPLVTIVLAQPQVIHNGAAQLTQNSTGITVEGESTQVDQSST